MRTVCDLLHLLEPNQRRGSKPRCHKLTHGTREVVAVRLTSLIEPWGSVSPSDQWMPDGFDNIEEAKLDKAPRLIPSDLDRAALQSWWLTVPRSANTPNWDIASTCK